ncbi:hypothetical protein B0A49_01527 [Cryomyces minteri]|uniref:Uncharacterized protein n=1 Tax=Cryomyces minteri TaxID=331657 RepID=A0A4U0XX20_9PEZI|nr:hypothetical protein B0A49_01527 [Cryomyces minteri]
MASPLDREVITIPDDEDDLIVCGERNISRASTITLEASDSQDMESMIDEDESDNSDDDDVEMLTPEELQDHFARMSMRYGATSMSTSIDLTTSPEPQVQAHNGTIELPLVEEDSWTVYGASIRPGNTVELQSGYTDKGGHHSGDFLRISHILRNVQNDGVILRGIRLRRTMFFNGMLERKLNEVAIVIHSNADDARPALQQGLEEVSLEEVVALPR